ncbi:ParA family protein [Acidithiobacillus ferrivorans]|nr:ParA family protein [Acidithiobacillus ferrivorans]
MHTLVVASQKGGVGKTTLSGHLGVMAVLQNIGPVALVDADPQGSLAEWWNVRKAEQPFFVKTKISQLKTLLKGLEDKGVALVIIDTPPAVTQTIQAVMSEADLVLIPTRPSPHDLRAVGSTVNMAEATGKRIIFVINGAANRARITGEAAVALSQHGTVAPVTLHQRTDFASSMIDGRTVMELFPNSRSTAEIRELWEYLAPRLGFTVE